MLCVVGRLDWERDPVRGLVACDEIEVGIIVDLGGTRVGVGPGKRGGLLVEEI